MAIDWNVSVLAAVDFQQILRNLRITVCLHNAECLLVSFYRTRQHLPEVMQHTLIRNVTVQRIEDMLDRPRDMAIEGGELVDVVAHARIVQGSR